MNNCLLSMTAKNSDREAKLLSRYVIRGILFIAGLLTVMTSGSMVRAQSGLSEAIDGGSVNVDNIRGYSNSFPLDSGGSQQFFEEGQDRIYFLPEESESEPILEIDKTVEAEGIKYEDLQPQNVDKSRDEDL